MRKTLILGGVVGISLLAYAAITKASNKKGEPVDVGQRVRVTYGTSQLSHDETLALLNFVMQWGDRVGQPVFSENGSEVSIIVDVAIAQPNGIPDIPGPTEKGDLFVSLVEFL